MRLKNFNIYVTQKNKNKKKGKDDKYGSEVTTPENSSSPGMMDMHGNAADLTVITHLFASQNNAHTAFSGSVTWQLL